MVLPMEQRRFFFLRNMDYDEAKIIADIKESRKRGKKHYIIINAEGIGDSMNMAKRIEKETGMETKT